MPPKKTLDQKKKDWSAIFAWVEWAVDDEGEDLYKCSVCTKGVWSDYRRFSGNMQKSLFDQHADDKHHRESLLQAEGKAQMKAYWGGIIASAQAKKQQEEAKMVAEKSQQFKALLWLVQNEVAMAKYPSFIELIDELVSREHSHTSAKSGWEMARSCSAVCRKRWTDKIREAPMHCLILDSTNDGDNWVAILCRFVDSRGRTETAFWDIVPMVDQKADTFVGIVAELYKSDQIDEKRCVAIASDGCTTMKRFAEDLSALFGGGTFWCHCLSHRLDLALSRDAWTKSNFCKMIEAGLRSAYLLFNRSTTRKKELRKLQSIYGKIQLPTSIIEIRWISKFQAVEALTNPSTMDAITHMLRDKDPDALTADEFNVLDLLEDHREDLLALKKFLMPLRRLTKAFQAKNLNLCDAMKLLNATQREVSLMEGLPVEVESLRHDFIQYLGSRFKADEVSWLAFNNVSQKYPDELVRIRFKLLKDKFHQLAWDDDDESFVLDCNRVMGAAKDEIDGGLGPDDVELDALGDSLGVGMNWKLYRMLGKTVSPTSVDAERTFSCLTRLRSDYRRALHVNLPHALRLAMVRGSTDVKDNELVAEIVKHWMNTRARRNRPKGIKRSAGGSIKKDEVLGEEASSDTSADEGTSAQAVAEEPGGGNPRPRRSAYMRAMARFKEMVGDEDEPDS